MDTNEVEENSRDGLGRTRVLALGADRVDWGQFVSAHRDRLRRMVALRLDQRLRGRIDPSDVIQEAFLEVVERRSEYERQPDPMPPFLWLRFLTLQRLQLVHRQHLGTRARDASARCRSTVSPSRRRARPHWRRGSWATTPAPARRPSAPSGRSGSRRPSRGWTPIDREVLVLRHFEQLGNGECARVLGLSESAANKRYIRALRRLKAILAALPGGEKEVWP